MRSPSSERGVCLLTPIYYVFAPCGDFLGVSRRLMQPAMRPHAEREEYIE